MKIQKIREYREMTDEQLKEKIKEWDLELVKSYGAMGMAKVKTEKEGTKKSGSDISKRIKKEIARIKTILRERRTE